MGLVHTLVTLAGVIAIIGLLVLLFCHYLGGWTWTKAWLFSSGEEKMILTKQGTRRHFNPNGYMVSSESDLNISGRGSFRRFDTTDNDYHLFRQGSNSSITRHHLLQSGQVSQIPPQPLRPAPNLPPAPLNSQSSLDSVFNTAPPSPAPSSVPRIPPPPSHHSQSGSTSSSITSHASQKALVNMGDTNLKNDGNAFMGSSGSCTDDCTAYSSTNPFLPLLKASSQGNPESSPLQRSGPLEQSYSASSYSTGATTGKPIGIDTFGGTPKVNHSTTSAPCSTSVYPSVGGGLSMGEILFSAPPTYQHQPNAVLTSSGTTSPLFSATPSGSPKPSHKVLPQRSASSGSPQHTSSRYNLYHQNSADNIIAPTSSTGIASPSAHSPTATPSHGLRRASYPNRAPYTPHETIPKSEFPQHIPYVPSFHHHHHAKGGNPTMTGSTDQGRVHHHHYLPSSSVAASVGQPFLEEQEEPPEEPCVSHTLTNTIKPLPTSATDVEREDLTNRIMLETMREEIRIANERMADVTKSLLMDDVFLPTAPPVQPDTAKKVLVKEGDIKIEGKINERSTNGIGYTSSFTGAGGGIPNNSNRSRMSSSAGVSSSLNTSSLAGRRGSTPVYTNLAGAINSFGISGASGGHSGRPTSLLQRSNSSGSNHETEKAAQSGTASLGSQLLKNADNVATSTFAGNNSLMNNVVTALASGIGASGKPPNVGSYIFKQSSRSFSFRQSSTDSIGSDVSDLGSPSADGSLPSLERAMSCDSVCSDTSVILGDLDPPHLTGNLCIGLEYDSETADLLVNVMEAKELVGPDPDPHAPFDSYVRVYLLPDKTTNMQTRVYRKSLSPVYKEKFMFGLEMSELASRSLVFYLYATDKYTNTLIGEGEMKLGDLDLSQPSVTWLMLTDTGQRGGEFGEIMFSLSYLPTAERLTVVVVKARNLRFPHERETGDPFVKVYLLQRGKKVSKKKSSTKRGERNPIFNEAMIFSIPPHALQTIQLRITAADSLEADGRAYSIGHVIVGSAATGKALSHWNQMLSSLRKPIAMWHALRK